MNIGTETITTVIIAFVGGIFGYGSLHNRMKTVERDIKSIKEDKLPEKIAAIQTTVDATEEQTKQILSILLKEKQK